MISSARVEGVDSAGVISSGDSAPGGTFADFEVLEVLVSCGILTLCQVKYSPDGSLWTLLLLSPEAFDSDERRSGFMDRMRTVSELEDKNLLSAAGVEVFGEWVGVVYEAFPGRPLLSYLGQKMEPAQAVRIIGAAADGIRAAHQIGVLHRDINPGWILIDEKEEGMEVKVACLGVVPALYDGDAEFLQSLVGRPAELRSYLAPEQLVPGDPSDFRADIYSLSAITYRLLVGRPPGGFTVLPSSRADVNRATDNIVLRALHTDRERRYQSVEEFGDRVRQIGAGNKNDPLAHLMHNRQQAEKSKSRRTTGRLKAALVGLAALCRKCRRHRNVYQACWRQGIRSTGGRIHPRERAAREPSCRIETDAGVDGQRGQGSSLCDCCGACAVDKECW